MKNNYLIYKSKDNLFFNIELKRKNKIYFITYFKSKNIKEKNFKTIRIFNLKGEMLFYQNSYGDEIKYEKPIKVNYKLKLIK
jgi:hypothetical protein